MSKVMASIHQGIFVRYNCTKCGNEIYMQVGMKNIADQLERLREGPPLYCAPCWQPEYDK